VVAVDDVSTGRRANVADLEIGAGFSFVAHDVTRPLAVDGPLDAVCHLASPASPPDYLAQPLETLLVGSEGTRHTLELARAKDARYLLTSTSEVYGDPLVHPQPETYWGNVNPVGPRSVYDEAKRFAEALASAHRRVHGQDVKIARIFNSILADEQVLYDDGRELRREPIEALASRLGAPSTSLSGYRVPAFDRKGRVGSHPAVAILGHPPSGPCFEVTTRYGRSIRVTGDHSLFVLGPDGRPQAKPVSQLRVGEGVALAARLVVPARDRLSVRMTEVVCDAGFDPWSVSLGWPGLGKQLWSIRQELKRLYAEHFPTKSPAFQWSYVRSCVKRDRVPLAAVRRLGLTVPNEATLKLVTSGRSANLPEHVIVTNELLWLLGLYVAEGCRYERPAKAAFITISCDDDLLDRATKIIERDLGLHVIRSAKSPRRSGAIFVHSVLLLRLLDHLGFPAVPKRTPGWILSLPLSRLKWFLEGYREGDGVHSGNKFEEGIRHEFSTTSEGLKDDLVVAFARFGLLPSVGRYETTFRQRTGERRYPFWRLTLSKVEPWSPLDWDRGVSQVLQAWRTGDLVWAPVKSIRQIEPTSLVYDFSVPGVENFWAGTGIMAHNTYGPFLRPGDGRVVSNFIVQALAGKPLTVYGDGSQSRSFCYVDDQIAGLCALLDSDWEGGPVNIGNADEHSVLELAELVIELTGSSSDITFEPLPQDDPVRRRPDIALAERVLGWRPRVPLREGLARTVEWFRRAS
jgi:nucleoside-diphosphate-sugar epimerase